MYRSSFYFPAQLFGNLYQDRKAKLLRHVIRSPNDGPLRQVHLSRIQLTDSHMEREYVADLSRTRFIMPRSMFLRKNGGINCAESSHLFFRAHKAAIKCHQQRVFVKTPAENPMFHVHHIDCQAQVQKCRELSGRLQFTYPHCI